MFLKMDRLSCESKGKRLHDSPEGIKGMLMSKLMAFLSCSACSHTNMAVDVSISFPVLKTQT